MYLIILQDIFFSDTVLVIQCRLLFAKFQVNKASKYLYQNCSTCIVYLFSSYVNLKSKFWFRKIHKNRAQLKEFKGRSRKLTNRVGTDTLHIWPDIQHISGQQSNKTNFLHKMVFYHIKSLKFKWSNYKVDPTLLSN